MNRIISIITILSGLCLQTVKLSAQDAQPPQITCPPGTTVSANEDCEAVIPDLRGRVVVSDNVTPAGSINLAQTPAPGTVVTLGIHTITVTATDAAGNQASCSSSFTVRDTTPPLIACAVRTPELWPPNHKLENVGLTVEALDNCDPNPQIRVRVLSDEDDEEATGDGRHSPDAKGFS